jgi:tRNA (pseudouridine54-N1)-methyltransferase
MNLFFFIKSKTVDINNYTIKDIPGSSGRLDVISRCILAAIVKKDGFEDNVEIWVFLDNYGTFVFNSELNYEKFPKNELLLTDYFVDFLLKLNSNEEIKHNPLGSIKISNIRLKEAIKKFQILNYSIYTLREDGEDFSKLGNNFSGNKDIVFIVGSQDDEFLNSKEFLALKLPIISIGNQSYLASSVIRLIKLHLLALP